MCCKNLKAILEASGSEIGKVVRVGVFLTDMKVCDFERVDRWEDWGRLMGSG